MVGDEGRKEWGPRSCRAYGLFLGTVGITGGFEHQIDGHGLTYAFKEIGGCCKNPHTEGVAWTSGSNGDGGMRWESGSMLKVGLPGFADGGVWGIRGKGGFRAERGLLG